MPDFLPKIVRPQGAVCSYSGSVKTDALSHEAVESIQKAAESCGLSLDIGNNYVEFAFDGRDSNQFVVEFLRTLAHAIGSATGAFRCEVQVEGEDPFFEFFSIRGGRLLRQRGVIVRQQEDDITSGEPDA